MYITIGNVHYKSEDKHKRCNAMMRYIFLKNNKK